MPVFHYKALNADGSALDGTIEGDSARNARLRLRAQGLVPLEVRVHHAAASRLGWPVFGRGLAQHDLAVLTRHLSTLVASGMPLDMALHAAAVQSDKKSVKALLLGIRSHVMEGHALADSLARYPHVFGDFFCAIVRAGEESGRLGEVLEQLAAHAENTEYTQQQLSAALFYPVALMAVALAVVGLLMIYVVPQMVRLFEYSGTDLPALTRALIAVSHFLSQGGALAALVLMGLGTITWRYWLRNEEHRLAWHKLCFHLPGVSGVIKTVESARFANTLGILVASGVPLSRSMRMAISVIGNRYMRSAARQALLKLEAGGSLSHVLKASGVFPSMTVHMIASGELSGELEKMLLKVASHQDRQMEFLRQKMLALFEPLLIVSMGGVVLLIVLAILLPIFDMNTLVR